MDAQEIQHLQNVTYAQRYRYGTPSSGRSTAIGMVIGLALLAFGATEFLPTRKLAQVTSIEPVQYSSAVTKLIGNVGNSLSKLLK